MRLHPAVFAVGAAVAAFATAASIPARAVERPFTLADLARVVSIASPQLAPDGRRAVALISRVDSEHDRTNDELDLIDVASGAHRALTIDRTGLAMPLWSPDGTRIAFIANTGEGER